MNRVRHLIGWVDGWTLWAFNPGPLAPGASAHRAGTA